MRKSSIKSESNTWVVITALNPALNNLIDLLPLARFARLKPSLCLSGTCATMKTGTSFMSGALPRMVATGSKRWTCAAPLSRVWKIALLSTLHSSYWIAILRPTTFTWRWFSVVMKHGMRNALIKIFLKESLSACSDHSTACQVCTYWRRKCRGLVYHRSVYCALTSNITLFNYLILFG